MVLELSFPSWSPRQRSGLLLKVPEDIPGAGNVVRDLGSVTFLTFCPQTRHRLHLSPSLSGSLHLSHPANSSRRGGEDKETVPGPGCDWCVQSLGARRQVQRHVLRLEMGGLCPHAPGCSGARLWASLSGLFLAGEVPWSSSERHVLTLTSSGNGFFPLCFSLRF